MPMVQNIRQVNGSVLINLKTGQAYLIYDEHSEMQELRDMKELFPEGTGF